MTKYGKSAGRDCVWLDYCDDQIAFFEPKHELIIDDILRMEATMIRQALELEQNNKTISQLHSLSYEHEQSNNHNNEGDV